MRIVVYIKYLVLWYSNFHQKEVRKKDVLSRLPLHWPGILHWITGTHYYRGWLGQHGTCYNTNIRPNFHYRRSPLVQRALEIPCNLTTSFPGYSAKNVLLQKYLEIVNDLYAEPKNEETVGSFLILVALTDRILNSQNLLKKEDLLMLSQNLDREFDIRTLFQRAEARNREVKGQQNKVSSVALID